ncbi:MAG: pyridoxal-dependent decarboxylase, partial [Acidimicrobiia bacterium]
MTEPTHMSAEEFRRHAHEMADWMADYLEQVGSLPIVPDLKPGDILALLPDNAPEEPEDFSALVADLERVVKPGLTGWQHPGFFAYFPGNVSPPAVLAEMVTASLGQQGMMW